MAQVFSHKLLERSLSRKGVQPSPTPPAIHLCALMARSFYVICSGSHCCQNSFPPPTPSQPATEQFQAYTHALIRLTEILIFKEVCK